MRADVLSRLLRGFGANAYGQVVTAVVQIVGVPILLHCWGKELYGEWLILFAIPSYLSMTDLGFSQSAGNDMTARVGRGDHAEALKVFQSLAGLVYAIVAAGLVLSAALLWALPLQNWMHLKLMSTSEMRWVLWLLAAQVFATLLNNVSHAGFRASGDYALHVSLNNTTRLLQFAGVWVIAIAGGGPVAAATLFFAVQALATPAFAVLLVYRHRWLRFSLEYASRSELRRLLKPAAANVAFPCAQALNIQGMVLVVGAVLGPLAVVVFYTLRTLTRLALQLVVGVSNAAEPELAVAYGAGDHKLMQSLFVHALRAALWLALTAAAVLTLFGSVILKVWTHDKVPMHPALFAFLLGSAVASVLWFGSLTTLRSANRHMRAASVYILASTAAVATAAFLLVWTKDIISAGAALLIMDTIMTFYTFRAAAQLVGVQSAESLAWAANPYPLLHRMWEKAFVR